MKERPILFSAPMVRAILAGQKTQTRRVVKPQPDPGCVGHFGLGNPFVRTAERNVGCPYGQPGDRLWVRETWREFIDSECVDGVRHELGRDVLYRADGDSSKFAWRPSIFMPRWASRIVLEVVSVRVERLNDISETDCWAEGAEEVIHLFDGPSQAEMANRLGLCLEDAKPLYALLWESINGAGSWDKNPWVWVVEFKRIEPPKGAEE